MEMHEPSAPTEPNFQSALETMRDTTIPLAQLLADFVTKMEKIGYNPDRLTVPDLVTHKITLMRVISALAYFQEYANYILEIRDLAMMEFSPVANPSDLFPVLAGLGFVPEALDGGRREEGE